MTKLSPHDDVIFVVPNLVVLVDRYRNLGTSCSFDFPVTLLIIIFEQIELPPTVTSDFSSVVNSEGRLSGL